MQKKNSTHLSADDRIRMEALLREAYSLRHIADRLDKSPSTISREIFKHAKVHTPMCCDCLNAPDCTLRHVCGSFGCHKKCFLLSAYPYDLAMAVLPEDFFLLLGLERIPACGVIMKPYLLKRQLIPNAEYKPSVFFAPQSSKSVAFRYFRKCCTYLENLAAV